MTPMLPILTIQAFERRHTLPPDDPQSLNEVCEDYAHYIRIRNAQRCVIVTPQIAPPVSK